MSIQIFKHQEGSQSAAGTTLLTIADAYAYNTFVVVGSSGSVEAEVSPDGQIWSGPIALDDLSSIEGVAVMATAAGTAYGFRGTFNSVRLKQVGVGASHVAISYGRM